MITALVIGTSIILATALVGISALMYLGVQIRKENEFIERVTSF